ncbi:MAG: ester cyclase [Chitinophagaceae bacterium]|nr:ester cyclase [Chitinophagaceae bacterium]
MKAYQFVFMTMILLGLAACQGSSKKEETTQDKPSTGLSATAQKNLDQIRKFHEFFVTGDVNIISDVIAVGAIDHSAPGEPLVANNMDTVKAYFTKLRSLFTDSKMTVLHEWADDEYVVQWGSFSGTSADPASGVPVGQKVENMLEVHISKMKDGKTIEHWSFNQISDLMKFMGPK